MKRALPLLLLALSAVFGRAAQVFSVPGFLDETLYQGNGATAVQFDFAGRMWVAEKQGRLLVFAPNPRPASTYTYEYFEKPAADPRWTTLPNFGALAPVRTGTVNSFTLEPRLADADFAFRFTGSVAISTAGTYTFYLDSDDGSRLYVDGALVVDRDGTHDATVEKSGAVTLSAGSHALRVDYFNGAGDGSLTVQYAGPGVTKTTVAAAPFLAPAVFYDFISSVDSTGDRGLTGFVLDPDYEHNHFLYVLYSTTTDQRIVRYTSNATYVARTSGQNKNLLTGLPNATSTRKGGSLGFHPSDPANLYVSVGDDGSAAQAANLDAYHGKLLKISAADGAGLATNPYYTASTTTVRSRVWAHKFANPAHFAFDPLAPTGDVLYVSENGDAGTDRLARLAKGADGGWSDQFTAHSPDLKRVVLQTSAPVKTGLAVIRDGAFSSGDNPILYGARNVPAEIRRWALTGANLDTLTPLPQDGGGAFYAGAIPHGFSSLTPGPAGALYYTETGSGASAGTTWRLGRIRQTGVLPIAKFTFTPSGGNAPIDLAFTDASEAGGGTLNSWSWNFGDGQMSDARIPTHTFAQAGRYTVSLTVVNTLGFSHTKQSLITLGPVENLGPGTISFTNATYTAQEGSGTTNAAITVQRTGGSNGAVSVTVSAVPGISAGEGADYAPGSTKTITWNDGESGPKSFVVPVLTDTRAEGSETLAVQLSAPTGGATVATATAATLTILDRPYDAWRKQYFGAQANSPETLPTADFEQDGRPNLLEYATGSNPTLAQANAGQTVAPAGDRLRLTFTRPLQPTGLTLRVQASDTLAAGSWTTIASKIGDAAWTSAAGVAASDHPATGAVAITDSASLGAQRARYLRLAVELAGYDYAALRVANPEEKVPSRKRGVCVEGKPANEPLFEADFRALARGVSWYYSWSATPPSVVPPADVQMNFLPMQFKSGSTTALADYLAAVTPKPPFVLTINEPNLKGQAFIDPQTTANLFKQVQDVAGPYGIPVIGPHMALGSAAADSITAFDPIKNADYTYTSMEPFLDAFLYYANAAGANVPATSFHSYGNLGEFKYFVQHENDLYHRPVWVTEYAYYGAPNATAARDYLIQATDYVERSPFVQGYAWFIARSSDNANTSLLSPTEGGVLTTLGRYYVAVPPHETDLYYRLPGRLPAENYAASANCDLRATTDADGLFDLTMAGEATADYHVLIETPGTYLVKIRAYNAGSIQLKKNGAVLATATASPAQASWQTLTLTVTLPAGPQTLQFRRNASVSALNWIEFELQ